MTDMQTSLPLLIRPSILKPVMHFSTQPLTGEMKCPRLYLCLAYSIPSPSMLMQHMHQSITKWYDPLYIITWLYWFIDIDLTCSSPLRWSIGAKSCSSFTVTRGPSLQSLQLALHTCNRSIEPSFILTFSTLVTWLHVMSQCNKLLHHHMCKLRNISKPFLHPLLTHMYLWTNHMCTSHKTQLVHQSCHSITKTKQGPFIPIGPTTLRSDALQFPLLTCFFVIFVSDLVLSCALNFCMSCRSSTQLLMSCLRFWSFGSPLCLSPSQFWTLWTISKNTSKWC
jgi:hypothetical protein